MGHTRRDRRCHGGKDPYQLPSVLCSLSPEASVQPRQRFRCPLWNQGWKPLLRHPGSNLTSLSLRMPLGGQRLAAGGCSGEHRLPPSCRP